MFLKGQILQTVGVAGSVVATSGVGYYAYTTIKSAPANTTQNNNNHDNVHDIDFEPTSKIVNTLKNSISFLKSINSASDVKKTIDDITKGLKVVAKEASNGSMDEIKKNLSSLTDSKDDKNSDEDEEDATDEEKKDKYEIIKKLIDQIDKQAKESKNSSLITAVEKIKTNLSQLQKIFQKLSIDTERTPST